MSKVVLITGPTSGIGFNATKELYKKGHTLILVGRSTSRVQGVISSLQNSSSKKSKLIPIIIDIQEPESIVLGVQEIKRQGLKIDSLINNAGVMRGTVGKNSKGWDETFATNFLGPFLFTQLLLRDNLLNGGATIINVVSAVEDIDRTLAVKAGFKGGRFISVAESAKGNWLPGGSKRISMDAYATSKQCFLGTSLELFRRLEGNVYVNIVEPGWIPNTGLGRDANIIARGIMSLLAPIVAASMELASTPARAGKLLSDISENPKHVTGKYYDAKGGYMSASKQVSDLNLQKQMYQQAENFLAEYLK